MSNEMSFSFSTNSARLASLFGLDQASAGHGNEFFQYTAPKQPKKGPGAAATGNQAPTKAAPTTTGTSTVLVATAVHAYRYTNGQYVKQGKFGAAVLGNHAAREVRMPPCLVYIQVSQIMPMSWFLPGDIGRQCLLCQRIKMIVRVECEFLI
ncbi:FK506-binding protein 15-like [Ailuropoda melanoleuca]|uniref:FK506-binding protein 15-like n=1 Tax=Ailuropoda melanoleuca TaxID=9646 RepID=UPI001494F0C1|nr:FK506-binding protein 15-like [Ailuropoda melanoleuca]